MALETRNQPVVDDTRRHITEIQAALSKAEHLRQDYRLALLKLRLLVREAEHG